MTKALLALNAGSSSIKFGLYGLHGDRQPALVARGTLEDKGSEPRFTAQDPDGKTSGQRVWKNEVGHEELIGGMLEWIGQHLGGSPLAAVGHRIVHGGSLFSHPVLLDQSAIDAVQSLTPLAPLHQPRSLEPILALHKLQPELRQVGCFDTAFHHTLAPPVSRYALPLEYEQAGIRKYGFHGLSYAFIAGRLGEIDPALPAKKTIVAHLGSGASLCAMRNGCSVDTTMGFSVLDGLMMGTRPGALDPGIVLHLQRQHGLTLDEVEHLLYHESGLLGVSSISSDMRKLSASPDPRAKAAIDLFAFRVAREAASLASTLEGLDAFVFTGGIGANDARIRAAVTTRLSWLGGILDEDANQSGAVTISQSEAPLRILSIPTDEEKMIAEQIITVLG